MGCCCYYTEQGKILTDPSPVQRAHHDKQHRAQRQAWPQDSAGGTTGNLTAHCLATSQAQAWESLPGLNSWPVDTTVFHLHNTAQRRCSLLTGTLWLSFQHHLLPFHLLHTFSVSFTGSQTWVHCFDATHTLNIPKCLSSVLTSPLNSRLEN